MKRCKLDIPKFCKDINIEEDTELEGKVIHCLKQEYVRKASTLEFWIKQVFFIPYSFGYEFSSLQNNSEDVDLSYKTDLYFWDCFGKEKPNMALISQMFCYSC